MSFTRAQDVRIRDSVLNSVHGDQHNVTNILFPSPGVDKLYSLAVTGAAYNSAERDPPSRCTPGTREDVIGIVRAWVAEEGREPILWITGPAGFGKSTIAQSVAEECAAQGMLAGSYFFSRGTSSRSSTRYLFLTLANQTTSLVPALRKPILAALESDPSLPGLALGVQLQKLIAEPFTQLYSSDHSTRVIVIDALDECDTPNAAKNIIRLFTDMFRQQPSLRLRLIVASRPEVYIQAVVRSAVTRTLIQRLDLRDFPATDDIRTFVAHRFSQIYEDHFDVLSSSSTPWPPPGALDDIVRKSDGLFVYASTALAFIDNPHVHPAHHLSIILHPDLPLSKKTSKSPYAAIDELYRQVLSLSLYTDDVRAVLGLVVHSWRPLNTLELAELLCLDIGDVQLALRGLHSILRVPTDHSGNVRLLHKSLCGFISDPERALQFHIDSAEQHTKISASCLKIIRSWSLRPRDWDELRTVMNRHTALQYACYHWVAHLEWATADGGLMEQLQDFADTTIPFLLELFDMSNRLPRHLPPLTRNIVRHLWSGLCPLYPMSARDQCLYYVANFITYLRRTLQFFKESSLGRRCFCRCGRSRSTGGDKEHWQQHVYKCLARSFEQMNTADRPFSDRNRDGYVCPTSHEIPTTLSRGGVPFDITVDFSSSTYSFERDEIYNGHDDELGNDDTDSDSAVDSVFVWLIATMRVRPHMGERHLQLDCTYAAVVDKPLTLHLQITPPPLNAPVFQPGPAILLFTVNRKRLRWTTIMVDNGSVDKQPTEPVFEWWIGEEWHTWEEARIKEDVTFIAP